MRAKRSGQAAKIHRWRWGVVALVLAGLALCLLAALPVQAARNTKKYCFPLDTAVWRISDVYGKRIDPFTGKAAFHQGLDLACAEGTAVRAVQDGVVTAAAYSPSYGNHLRILHPKNQSEKAILTARRAWCYLVLVLISFLCLFFFYVLIINSTRTHFEIQKGFSLMPGKSIITNFRNVLTDANIPVVSGIRNSLLVSACSAALSVYFSALTAYGIYAYNFKFKKAAFALILLIMTMPTQVSALGFLQLISKMGLKNSFIPLIVPSIAAPTVFFFMKQYLDASLPMEIVEAARIDGAGEFYTFNKIVLPIMKPALAVQAIFSFVASWNNYFIPALVLDTADKKTLPILIAQLRSADFLKFDMGKVYMMVAIAILPVIVVYLLLSKFIVRGVALGGVKG